MINLFSFICKIPCYWIQRETEDIEDVRPFFLLIMIFYVCLRRDLSVLCACNSSVWKHSFRVYNLLIFSVWIPRYGFAFGSFRNKAGWSLTALLRWTEVCFQSPCYTERHSHGHLWLVFGDLKMEMSWLGQFLFHWPSATGAEKTLVVFNLQMKGWISWHAFLTKLLGLLFECHFLLKDLT